MPKSKSDIAIEGFLNSIIGKLLTLVGALIVLAVVLLFIYLGAYKAVLFFAVPVTIITMALVYKNKARRKELYVYVKILLTVLGGGVLIILVFWAWINFILRLP